MKRLLLILAIILVGAVLTIQPNAVAIADDENEEFHKQQFLFMLEEVYPQERGEWQVTFDAQYLEGKKSREIEYGGAGREDTLRMKNEWRWVIGMEYGIFDWLEASMGIPFANVDETIVREDANDNEKTIRYLDRRGISDIEIGSKLGLIEDERDIWIPALSLEAEVSFPTGNWKKDLGSDRVGFEYAALLGKTYEKWAYHLNFGGGYTNNAREEGETGKVNELELEYGAALVYMPFKALSLICEYKSEFEKEDTKNDGDNYKTEIYVVPGISIRVSELIKILEELEIGVSAPIGLTYESYDWGVMAKVLYEWGGED